jgi:dihydrofolate synthase/folylpolyglutamate synthase
MDIPIALGDKTKVVRVILDVAHNPQAMEYLISKLSRTYPSLRNNVRIVVGMSADKDLKQCTDTILKYLDGDVTKLHLVAASHPRAASVEKILECNPILRGAHYCPTDVETQQSQEGNDALSLVAIQVREALNLAAANAELVVVCGSVFIMADAREELGIVEARDSKVIAAVAGAGLRSSQENFGDNDNVTN